MLQITLIILYVLGFIFACFRAGPYTCDKLGVFSRSITACIAMTFGIALLWPAIFVENVIRTIIAIETGVEPKAWDR
jgi:hypothetical protein